MLVTMVYAGPDMDDNIDQTWMLLQLGLNSGIYSFAYLLTTDCLFTISNSHHCESVFFIFRVCFKKEQNQVFTQCIIVC